MNYPKTSPAPTLKRTAIFLSKVLGLSVLSSLTMLFVLSKNLTLKSTLAQAFSELSALSSQNVSVPPHPTKSKQSPDSENFINDLGQTLIAHYPLRVNANNQLGLGVPLNISKAPFRQGGLYCDGVYTCPGADDHGCYIGTPFFNYNIEDFSVEVQFKADNYARRPVLVGGRGFRWMGYTLTEGGGIRLLYNNYNYVNCRGRYIPQKWHTARMTYQGNKGQLYLDGRLICEHRFEIVHGNNFDFTTTNFSTGETFRGYIRELKVYTN